MASPGRGPPGHAPVRVRLHRSARAALRSELERLARTLRSFPDRPGRASFLERYLGSPVPVRGLTVPELRRIVHDSARRWQPSTPAELHRFCGALWRVDRFEERSLAVLFLERHRRQWSPKSWRIADGWVDRATGWAMSDGLASGPLARMVATDRERLRDLARWSRSPNPWRRRASLYALNALIRSGKLRGPLAQLDRLLDDPDPWVQRAAGTWLRECWKVDARRTRVFLLARARRLTPTVITVATDRAPREFRSRLRRLAGVSRGFGPRGGRRSRRPAGRE